MGRPFSFLCVSVMLGIVLGYFSWLSMEGYIFIGILAMLVLCMVFYKKYTIIFISLIFLLAGNLTFHHYIGQGTLIPKDSSQDLIYEAEIRSTVTDRNRYLEYDIYIHRINSYPKTISVNEKSKLQVKNHDLFHRSLAPGDRIILKNPMIIEELAGSDLEGYLFYIRSKGFNSILETEGENITAISQTSRFSLPKNSYETRNYIEGVLDYSLPSVNSNMLKSIMFGNQGYLDTEALELFSISGTAHIIAVSGLHVGVIALLLHHILGFLNFNKRNRILITMVILFFYSAIVNFPVSILRASAMYYLYALSFFVERKYDAINSLMLIALILLLYNPLYLFTVSFQLSFAATLSILLLYPIIKARLVFIPRFLQSLLAVTIAAQLGTIPILLFHFQRISLVSFIANVLIVPTLVPLLFIAFASVFLSIFYIELAVTINFLTNILLTYIHWIVHNLSQWPLASIEVEGMNFFHITTYYSIGFVVYLIMWKKKQKKAVVEKE